jgi:hypothetical protein
VSDAPEETPQVRPGSDVVGESPAPSLPSPQALIALERVREAAASELGCEADELEQVAGRFAQVANDQGHPGPQFLDVLKKYGPSALEAVMILACKLAGVAVP